MPSPFLITRFVVFALLVHLNLLILIFAAWNTSATVSAGLSVSTTTVILILNSCSAFLFIMLGLAELLVRQATTSRLLFECCWSAILSVFQIGAAISISINGPEICGNALADWGLCASTYLLIPTSWLSTLVAFTYFFVLFFTTMAHSRVHAGIWNETVCSVQWFNDRSVLTSSMKSDEHSESDFVPRSRPADDLESSRKLTADHEKAPWAQSNNIRRGVDMPFKIQGPTLSVRPSASTAIISLPIVPLNAQGRDTVGSRFIEKFRESQLTPRSETAIRGFISEDPFPSKVDNHDLPIPLPRLSEWIRADAVKGINVHTIPESP